MKKIFKYPLEIKNQQEISMPFGAVILTVQLQHDEICIWAKVNPANSPENVTVYVVGTGHEIPDGTAYIGSVQQGPWVWHIFI